jgi:hypothetical protein
MPLLRSKDVRPTIPNRDTVALQRLGKLSNKLPINVRVGQKNLGWEHTVDAEEDR